MEPLIDVRRADDVAVARSVYKDLCCRISDLGILIPDEWATWESYLHSTLKFSERKIHEIVLIIEKGPAGVNEDAALTDFTMVMRHVAFCATAHGMKYPAMRFTTSTSVARSAMNRWDYSDWDAPGRVVGYTFKTSDDSAFTKLSIYFADINEDVLKSIQQLVAVFPYRVRIVQLYTPGDHSPVWVAYNGGRDCYTDCFADKSAWDIFKPDVKCLVSDLRKSDAYWRDGWDMSWFKKEPGVDLSTTEFVYF